MVFELTTSTHTSKSWWIRSHLQINFGELLYMELEFLSQHLWWFTTTVESPELSHHCHGTALTALSSLCHMQCVPWWAWWHLCTALCLTFSPGLCSHKSSPQYFVYKIVQIFGHQCTCVTVTKFQKHIFIQCHAYTMSSVLTILAKPRNLIVITICFRMQPDFIHLEYII